MVDDEQHAGTGHKGDQWGVESMERAVSVRKDFVEVMDASASRDGLATAQAQVDFSNRLNRISQHPDSLSPEMLAIAYNTARSEEGTLKGVIHPQDHEKSVEALFSRLDEAAFGQEGKELEHHTELLKKGDKTVLEWHGAPIRLHLGQDAVPVQDGQAPRTVTAVLRYSGKDEWWIEGFNDQRDQVGPSGTSLGRGSMPSSLKLLEEKHGYSADPMISVRHLELIPNHGGTLTVVDTSTNGTAITESYFRAREVEAPSVDEPRAGHIEAVRRRIARTETD